jgi:hypothetical protein
MKYRMSSSMEEFAQFSAADVAAGDPHVVYDANMLLVNIYQLIDISAQFLDVYHSLLLLFYIFSIFLMVI